MDRLTVALTPFSLFSLVCTRAEQAAQVMPPMTSSTSVVAGTVSVSVSAAATFATSAGLGITHRPDPGGSTRLNLLRWIVDL